MSCYYHGWRPTAACPYCSWQWTSPSYTSDYQVQTEPTLAEALSQIKELRRRIEELERWRKG